MGKNGGMEWGGLTSPRSRRLRDLASTQNINFSTSRSYYGNTSDRAYTAYEFQFVPAQEEKELTCGELVDER